jgi:hypothetical protein
MKRLFLLLITALMIILCGGCKKCDCFDSSKYVQGDFIGTWKGTISTFKDNKQVKKTGEVIIYQAANGLEGIINMEGVYRITGLQFNNGFWYFDVVCSDTLNPECYNWSLSGFAVFSEAEHIDFHIAGNECGTLGKQYVNWEGTLAMYSDLPDPALYYSFGKQGNTWNYLINKKSTDTCMLQQKITEAPSDRLFNGSVSNSCGWPWQHKLFYWYLDPVMYTMYDESGNGAVAASFPIDVTPGQVYSYIHGNDTTQVTLVARYQEVTVPAGKYICTKYRIVEPADSVKSGTKTDYFLWINNQFGIIKKEVTTPSGPNDILTQILLNKSF